MDDFLFLKPFEMLGFFVENDPVMLLLQRLMVFLETSR